MTDAWNLITSLLGLGIEPKELNILQISVRGVIVMACALVMVRLSSKRSLAEKTAFDAVLLIVLASVLARAVNGSAAFFSTLGASFLLVFVHRGVGSIACRSHKFGVALKGDPEIIVENGQMNREQMQRNQISEHDLEEDMRLSAKTEDLSQIKVARVERSGDISFIKRDGE